MEIMMSLAVGRLMANSLYHRNESSGTVGCPERTTVKYALLRNGTDFGFRSTRMR
jgi:hypothetical protein